MRNSRHRIKHIFFELCQQFYNLDAEDNNEIADCEHVPQDPEIFPTKENIVDSIHKSFKNKFEEMDS